MIRVIGLIKIRCVISVIIVIGIIHIFSFNKDGGWEYISCSKELSCDILNQLNTYNSIMINYRKYKTFYIFGALSIWEGYKYDRS